MPRWSIAAAALLAVSLSMGLGRSAAEPLPKEECDKLKAEQADLTAAGVRDQLGRGADWGKANLNADQMRRVARYIALEEQLSFRCGLAKLRASLPVAEEGGEQELDENGQPIPPKKKDGAGEANVKPKAKAPAKAASRSEAGTEASPGPRPRPKAAKAPSDGKAQAQSQPTAAKPRPKPKAKVDDAYRPATPQDPGADPFAGQVPAAQPKQ
jgi:hypothetical protein